ncbi:GDNF-inducible zinc finger protein 1-like [Belonocnema kinseyi]|uniref:GDNF-inducible zinc finger protein 1-like n=1 Tax=Belonocnema kinseyi TaxID=2817044 RepID=UPI00143D72EA|nr:GDNF-inducible zinc finger protein 1-like [Belonocnema kinseyi]
MGAERNFYDNNLTSMIEYDEDQSLEIKEEIIQVAGSSSKKDVVPTNNQKYQLKECNVNMSMNKQLHVYNFGQIPNQVIIQEPKNQSAKKYKCDKCVRSYTYQRNLYRHKKYECNVRPQFRCNFCDKKSRHKRDLRRHINQVHLARKKTINTWKTFNFGAVSEQFVPVDSNYIHTD